MGKFNDVLTCSVMIGKDKATGMAIEAN